MHQIGHDTVSQGRSAEYWIASNLIEQCDGAIVVVVLPQQTAGSFAAATASAAAAAGSRLLRDEYPANLRCRMLQVLTKNANQLIWTRVTLDLIEK